MHFVHFMKGKESAKHLCPSLHKQVRHSTSAEFLKQSLQPIGPRFLREGKHFATAGSKDLFFVGGSLRAGHHQHRTFAGRLHKPAFHGQACSTIQDNSAGLSWSWGIGQEKGIVSEYCSDAH
jgi:hypothetical protein